MRRVGIVVALVGLAALGLMGFALASPATPAPSPVPVSPAELAGAVPVSMTIRNDGDTPDVLVGASTTAAERAVVHATRLIDGRREMEETAGGIAIPAETTIVFEPGADHLMLVGLREALVQGDEFPLTVRFARAGEVTVRVRVRRKVDAAGLTPMPPVRIGALCVSFASVPPAPEGHPPASPAPS
jgi:periplasmic copper chaperone A